MTPFAHIVSTAAIVAAGIAVYDLVVVKRPDAAALGASREPESQAPAPVGPAVEAAPPPALLGVGDEHRRATLERRLAALERHVDVRRDPAAGQGPPHAEGTVSEPTIEPAGASTDGTDPVKPEEVRRFRRVLEAAEREIMIEKATKQVEDFLDKVGAKLTDEQRHGVVKTALKFQGKWREMSKEQPKGEQQIQERKDAYGKVMTEFEQEIRNVVPGVEANIIIDGIRRASSKESQK